MAYEMEQHNESISLHERRRRRESDGPVNFSQIRRPCPSVRTDMDNKRLSAVRLAQMTPPETPLSAHGGGSSPHTQPGLFHNYLRAFCHYDQPVSADMNDDEDGALITAAIRPGDLILVHSVHQNGWADGTVLTTGARGWLPTNYCEKFDHPYMRNLLNAMTQFWDLLGAGEDANLSTFIRQDYVRGLIAGVRYLLEHASCLHRDAPLVQRNSGIRRLRKGLLADLSTLVTIAKRLQDTISEPFAGEVIHVLLDDLITKAFRVVTRAVGFVDLLAQEYVGITGPTPYVPPTPSQNVSPKKDTTRLAASASSTPRTALSSAMDSAIAFPPTPCSEEQNPTTVEQKSAQHSDVDVNELRSPMRFRPTSGLLAHRVSVIEKRSRNNSDGLASNSLSRTHDECISHVGAFIGLYLHSRPSSELVATTERLVKACEKLLYVVDEVVAHDTQNTQAVQQARINFQGKLDLLTQSTKDVFKFSDSPDDDIIMLPEQTNHLVNVGTSLIRTVGECVIKTRKLIEQVGDFELDVEMLRQSEDGSEVLSDGHSQGGASFDESERANIRTTPTKTKRLSQKALPPPPPLYLRDRAMTTTAVTDFANPGRSFTGQSAADSAPAPAHHSSLPPPARHSIIRESGQAIQPTSAIHSPVKPRTSSASPARKCSVGTSMTSSTDTYQSNLRDSDITAVSEGSTRATTPDHNKDGNSPDAALLNSFGSLSSLQSAVTTDESSDVESQLLQKTYANELTLNKDGQVSGGSLAALVEQLTTHDSAPDAQFVSAFFLTFRSFTTPRELAQALLHRFDYIGDSKNVGTPVRLRIYNVFKGWLEVYWNPEADKDALGDVRFFALHKLKPMLPQAGDRLVELTRKVSNGYTTGRFNGPLVSGVGKISTSITATSNPPPEPVITKTQLQALRTNPSTCFITDFDPLEVARQLTLIASKTFCAIQPEELLSLDWSKKDTRKAQNVRHLCVLNTDLAHVVGDTILAYDDAKKRAGVIKHWAKVATICLELNNYESLMAITCSLNSSVVQRLKRTWEVVSKKTKARLEELNTIVDFSRNHASLRRRLEKPVAPCLPFLGVYLTDLTFADAGNPKMRELPNSAAAPGEEPMMVINFDKHMRMARIVAHLQRFQTPYQLQDVLELQDWMNEHLQRMREENSAMVGQLHRRSLLVEPKDKAGLKQQVGGGGEGGARRFTDPEVEVPRKLVVGRLGDGKGLDGFLKGGWGFGMKGRVERVDEE